MARASYRRSRDVVRSSHATNKGLPRDIQRHANVYTLLALLSLAKVSLAEMWRVRAEVRRYTSSWQVQDDGEFQMNMTLNTVIENMAMTNHTFDVENCRLDEWTSKVYHYS